jgi:Na+/H+ antiporter NhaC
MKLALGIVVACIVLFAAIRFFRALAARGAVKQARSNKLEKEVRDGKNAVRRSINGRR